MKESERLRKDFLVQLSHKVILSAHHQMRRKLKYSIVSVKVVVNSPLASILKSQFPFFAHLFIAREKCKV